jgi:PA-IL-like protein
VSPSLSRGQNVKFSIFRKQNRKAPHQPIKTPEYAMTQFRSTGLLAAVLVVAAESGILADVLVLRDGRRVDGVLVGVRGDTIEFEHQSGRDRGRVIRYERADVRTIEFDNGLPGNRYRDDGFPGGGRMGMRERTVLVDSRTPWTDAGVDIRSGQQILFTATGQVRWGPNRRDGAAGERNSPFNQGRPMPDRNAAALIGRIGENGDPFFIGDTNEAIRVRGSGRLFLGLNDDYLGDNSGSLRVVIAY